MADCRLVTAEDYIVRLDFGQFYLNTYRDLEDDPDDELPDIGELVDMAIEADGIAQMPGTLVVLSPHQNNFEMPLRVEVWDGPPPDDAAEWPEAFEAHLEIDRHGLSYDSPTMGMVSLGVPPGGYHALITGRGFVAHGWPGSTTPGDSWRIRLWPSAGPDVPRRLSAWHAPGKEPARPVVAAQAPGSQPPDHRPGPGQTDELRGPGGHQAQRDIAERPGVVVVVALDAAGRILLVPEEGALTALPARQVDQPGEDPLTAAWELLDEAGLRADTWNTLLDLPALPGETNAPSRVYLARDLRPAPAEQERIRQSGGEHSEARPRASWVTLDQAVSDVFANVIRDGAAAAVVVAAAQARDTCWSGLQPAPLNPGRR